jgi:hypothetical protein
VNSSWESLDRTRETTKLQIDRDLEELEKITARLAKNRRILKLAEARAKAKTICLIDELEEEEELERVKNGGMTNGEVREAQATLEPWLGPPGSSMVEYFLCLVLGYMNFFAQRGRLVKWRVRIGFFQ